MNESIRSLIFVGAAALVGLVAWATRPVPPAVPDADMGEIFKPFEPADANSFKIVRYDEDQGELNTFEVTKERGRWVIPSHDGYPADAEEQLKKIAGLFVELRPIAKVSDDATTHALYGVKEPKADASGDAKEYGRVVTIADRSGDPLVELIVGKEAVTDTTAAGAESKESHFVRRVGQDPVYVAEISLDSLTTKFEDWIERDLLQLNSFDVARLDLRDYSIVPAQDPNTGRVQLALLRRMDTQVNWNSEKSEWELAKMIIYQNNEALEGDLAEDEELNKSKLDGVKTAVDDLKIIDVDRKPQVLADALKNAEFTPDQETMEELSKYGFFVMRGEQSKPTILGSNGGMRISMKDGVQYLLNFGNAKSAEEGDSTKLNRYLMVTAQVDESLIAMPQLEPEEQGPAAPEGDKPADEKDAADAAPADEDEEQEEPAADKQEDKSEASDAKSEDDAAKEDAADDDAAKKERDRIKKENKRKMDEYNDKKKKAEARVAELNARFGNWFYVVSDDVYKKVQLGRADIVKDRETAKEEGFGVDAFRSLEKGGIEGKKSSSTPPPSPPIPGLPPGFPM